MAGDPYQELGVKKTASADELQKAFRKLAKELHPDRNPGNKVAEERFKRVSAAFDLLKDPEKRRKFDRGEMDADGREGFRPQGSPFGGGSAGGGFGGAGTRFDGIDLGDIFDMFGTGGGSPRGRGAQGGGFRPPPTKGADLKIKIDVDLMDTIIGNTRRVILSDGRSLDINIPKGCKDAQTLRLKGQGAASSTGGVAGDALIEIHIKPHPIFELQGNDLYMDLYVSLPDAVLGGKLKAPTPDGDVTVTIPAGSSSGSILRLKARGALDPKTNLRGDLLARILIALPENSDETLNTFMLNWRQRAPYIAQAPQTKKKGSKL